MSRKVRFVICGFGNVGEQLVRMVQADQTGQLEIAAIAARNLDRAASKARGLGLDLPIITAAEAPRYASTIVESATYDGFRDVLEPALRAGCHVIAVSVGALAANLDLIDLAETTGGTLQIANGALPGLDIVRGARESNITELRLISRILPQSLVREAYIAEHGIDLKKAETEPVPVFSGSARAAARHFPRHFNVAVALSLAGIGLDRTQVEITADGRIPGAEHTVKVKADAIELELVSRNFPSPHNNRTSRIVAPSIIAALRNSILPLRIGS